MTDGNTAVEIGSNDGYMAMADHYCLEFESRIRLGTHQSFIVKTDCQIPYPGLLSGKVQIYYSNNNITWTAWGDECSKSNGGIFGIGNEVYIVGNGAPTANARYWKFYVVEDITDSNGTVGMTELTAITL